MSISSNKFVFRLKHATVFLFKLFWENPIVSVLVCSSGLLAVLFPKVFKSLAFVIPVLVSTVLFLGAIFSLGSQAPESIKESSEKSHEDDKHKEFGLKRFNVIYSAGEAQIADCKDQTKTEIAETIQEEIDVQHAVGNFEDTSEIKNRGMNPADSKFPEKQEATAANGDPEEVIRVHQTSSESPLRAWTFEREEAGVVRESVPAHRPKYFLGLVAAAAEKEEEEDNNDKQSEFSFQGGEKGGDDHQQKPTQNSVVTTKINNAGRNLMESMIPEDQEAIADQEEAISVYETSSRSPLDVFIEKIQEEKALVPVEQPKISSGLGTEEEEDNDKQPEFSFEGREGEGNVFDIPPMNFFSMPLKSSWTRFDCSSGSISEASSLGSLGPLFDGLDPLLLTDEDDDPHASIQAHDDDEDRPMDWTEEDDGDENLFGLVKDGSDSISEEDNLIEIELSEQQLMKRSEQELRQLQREATEKLNLIDLDYSDNKEERLQNLMDFFSEKEGVSFTSALQEEENLIEIDLSADTLLVPANGEIIQSDSAANKEKVSPIQISARNENPFADLLSEPLNQDYSYETPPWKDVWIPKTEPQFVPETTADLSDLNSPSIKEMKMVGLEDEKTKPGKTETCDESICFFGSKEIHHNKITNLLD